ncbi:class F sortase [Nocardioides guangzhouensis]|uniref:class F sortase n=1 Tax=Nocardioides guangzhouensis TaxID=2497878 RepID=UPI001438408C|nr:class F sortase [Nocardioides guangzhouensis]
MRGVPGPVLVAAAALLTTLVAGCGLRDGGTGERTAPSPGATERRTPTPVAPARRAASQVTPEGPRAIRLPDGTVLRVRAVGTRADGELAVPDDVRVAGWWRGGSRLGDPFGATLVAGHVDSRRQGLGPYAALLSATAGQQVVLQSRHLRQDFRVRSLRLVRQAPLRHQPWIHSAGGDRRLVLVTCAPPYLPSRGGYQNLAVVTAVPTGPPQRRGP